MATMLSGAAIIDAAILVVAANEGIKPQTVEHLIALQAKGIKNLIVVQNKIDLVDSEKAKKNYKEIKDLLKGRYDDAPVIPVSAQQGVNLSEVYRAIFEIPVPKRKLDGEPIFIVARSFDINKPGVTPDKLHGAVLGGTLKQGVLKVGDEIEIKPGRVVKEANQYRYHMINTKVKKLFKGSEEVSELTPGGSMSMETELDMTLGKADALAGCVVSLKGKLPEITEHLDIKYILFPEVFGVAMKTRVEPLKPSEMIMLSVNTSMTVGIIKRIQKDKIEITLKVPIVPFKGDSVAIARNLGNHWRLIGYGEIL
jgi:translation initiation factor 2 subunit 3